MTRPKSFIHLDTDAFYPAVEVLDNPDLKGKPVFVGGRKERGVVSSTDDGFEIYSVVCDLLKKSEVGKRPVRLLGVSLSQLSFVGSAGQQSLCSNDQSSQKRKELNVALDSIHQKHGEKSVRPGTLFSNK